MSEKEDKKGKSWFEITLERYSVSDRIIISILIICLLIIYFMIRASDVREANLVLAGGVAVTLCLGLFDRLGLLLPVQQSISKVSVDLRTNLQEISTLHQKMLDDFHHQMGEVRKTAGEAVAAFDSYEKYRSSRQDFGFVSVAGQDVTVKQDGPHFESNSVFMAELKGADSNTTIYYMNTFLEQYQQFRRALLDAVHSGAHIKILLMNPKSPEICKRRWNDAYQMDFTYDDFVSDLLQDARKLCILRDQAAKESGRIEIRFYSDSINYPLVAVGRADEKGAIKPVVIYTGFYGARTSEDMPYIEWRGGSFGAYDKFMGVFENKWRENQTNTEVGTSDNGK